MHLHLANVYEIFCMLCFVLLTRFCCLTLAQCQDNYFSTVQPPSFAVMTWNGYNLFFYDYNSLNNSMTHRSSTKSLLFLGTYTYGNKLSCTKSFSKCYISGVYHSNYYDAIIVYTPSTNLANTIQYSVDFNNFYSIALAESRNRLYYIGSDRIGYLDLSVGSINFAVAVNGAYDLVIDAAENYVYYLLNNGDIGVHQINTLSGQTFYSTTLKGATGLFIKGSTLYIAYVCTVYKLRTDNKVLTKLDLFFPSQELACTSIAGLYVTNEQGYIVTIIQNSASGYIVINDVSSGAYITHIANAVSSSSLFVNNGLCLPGLSNINMKCSGCLFCPEGYYCNSTAKACPLNTYSRFSGRHLGCVNCPSNAYTSQIASTSINDCKCASTYSLQNENCVCSAGFFANETTSENQTTLNACVACASGTYSASRGASACTRCSVNSYQPNVSATACVQCAAGEIQPQPHRYYCMKCARNYVPVAPFDDPAIYYPFFNEPYLQGKFTIENIGPSPPSATISGQVFLPAFTLSPQWSICLWMQVTESSRSMTIIGLRDTNIQNYVLIEYNGNSDSYFILAVKYGNVGLIQYTLVRPVSLGRFYHVCVVKNDLFLTSYVDNNSSITTTTTVASPVPQFTVQSIGTVIGLTLDEIRVYDYAINASQVASIYNYKACRPCVGTECDCDAGTFNTLTTPCTNCSAGTYQPNRSSTFCFSCAAGTYSTSPGASSASVCTSCDLGSYSTGTAMSSSGACSTCVAGSYASARGATACSKCTSGTYASGSALSQCSMCTQGQYASTSGASACTYCANGTYNAAAGLSECYPCPPNSWCASGTRNTCPLNSSSPAGSEVQNACLCQPGFFGNGGRSGTSPCALCWPNYYCPGGNGNLSLACPSNSKSASGSASISDCSCNDGYVRTSNNTCVCAPNRFCTSNGSLSCPANSSAAAGATSVDQCLCDAGFYRVGSVCLACEVGFYCARQVRTQCTGNATTASIRSINATECFCDRGFVGVGNAPCAPCPLNSWCWTGVANACPANTEAPPFAHYMRNCTCVAGYEGPGGGPCFQCAPGSICNNGVARLCASGSFSAGAGVSACTTCDSGSFSSSNGSTTCALCAAGFYASSSGVSTCSACAAGTFRAVSGASSCVPCSPHSYAPATNATACTSCWAGSEAKGSGSTSCSVCARGQYSLSGSPCSNCSQGFYNTMIGSSTCTVCVPGYYNDWPGLTFCTMCPANSWCASGTRNTCPLDASSAPNSSSQQACLCNPGYVGDGSLSGSSPCGLCLQNKYCPGGNGRVQLACPANAQSEPGSFNISQCVCNADFQRIGDTCVCSPGRFCSDTGAAACPANSFSPLGATSIKDCVCERGFFRQNDECLACPVGSYCPGDQSLVQCTGNATTAAAKSWSPDECFCVRGFVGVRNAPCVPCPRNSWCWTGIANPCPDNSVSPLFASYASNCTCVPGHYGDAGGPCYNCAPNSYCLGTLTPPRPCPEHSTSMEKARSVEDCVCDGVFWRFSNDTCKACSSCLANAKQVSTCSTYNDTVCLCNSGLYGNGIDVCSFCDAGMYSIGETCASCPLHSDSPVGAGTIFDCACDADYYFNVSSCATCPTHSASAKGSTAIADCACEADYYFDVSECATCPTHSVSAVGSTRISDCLCNAGFYDHDNSCSLCAEDTFCPGDETWHACPSDSTTLLKTGSTSVSDCVCNAGFYEHDDSCFLCAEDTFCPGDETLYACFANSSTMLNMGSTSVSDCVCDAGFVRNASDLCLPCPPAHWCELDEAFACPEFAEAPPLAWSPANCSCVAGYVESSNSTCVEDAAFPWLMVGIAAGGGAIVASVIGLAIAYALGAFSKAGVAAVSSAAFSPGKPLYVKIETKNG